MGMLPFLTRWWTAEFVFMRFHLPIVIAKWKIFSHFILSAALLSLYWTIDLDLFWEVEKANTPANLFVRFACFTYLLSNPKFIPNSLFYPCMEDSAGCLRFLACAELHPLLADMRWGTQSWAVFCEERYRTCSDSFTVCCSFCAWWVPWRSVQYPDLRQVFRTQHWACVFWEASLALCLLEWISVCHSWLMHMNRWERGSSSVFCLPVVCVSQL